MLEQLSVDLEQFRKLHLLHHDVAILPQQPLVLRHTRKLQLVYLLPALHPQQKL